VTGDLSILLGNEREQQIAVDTQIVDELADRFAGKAPIEQSADVGDIFRPLVAYLHVGYCCAESLSISF
jgi:hypothetical protein